MAFWLEALGQLEKCLQISGSLPLPSAALQCCHYMVKTVVNQGFGPMWSCPGYLAAKFRRIRKHKFPSFHFHA